MIGFAPTLAKTCREPRKVGTFLWMLLRYKYLKLPYREVFRKMMEFRSAQNPKAAVGGMWEEIGELQLRFLLKNGLKPSHKLLDVGCGSLRGGVHFIKYLESGNYWGIDISEPILLAGSDIVRQEKLAWKNPTLVLTDNLEFKEIRGQHFDYVFAHSVFTHMPFSDMSKILMNAPRIMENGCRFFATILDGMGRSYTNDHLNFYHSLEEIKMVCRHAGMTVTEIDYGHPRGQKMLKFAKKFAASPRN